MKWLARLKKRSNTGTPDRLAAVKIVEEIQDGIDKSKMEPRKKPILETPGKKKRKKRIRELQKELDELMEGRIKMELRTCRGDADLRQKEEDVEMLQQKIRMVERDLDLYLYTL